MKLIGFRKIWKRKQSIYLVIAFPFRFPLSAHNSFLLHRFLRCFLFFFLVPTNVVVDDGVLTIIDIRLLRSFHSNDGVEDKIELDKGKGGGVKLWIKIIPLIYLIEFQFLLEFHQSERMRIFNSVIFTNKKMIFTKDRLSAALSNKELLRGGSIFVYFRWKHFQFITDPFERWGWEHEQKNTFGLPIKRSIRIYESLKCQKIIFTFCLFFTFFSFSSLALMELTSW